MLASSVDADQQFDADYDPLDNGVVDSIGLLRLNEMDLASGQFPVGQRHSHVHRRGERERAPCKYEEPIEMIARAKSDGLVVDCGNGPELPIPARREDAPRSATLSIPELAGV